ncbi:CYTH domain-containing protein [Vaginisenegalia massiliensis]|uniref:CYTH domain-containing protein n=1 Tax=Vaginisenegalia massiliensis TaxID=2058294 RepID=UPI000F523201|nr:CYTH domain-containing protein [Vaginisenegalia massiliensis]
MATSIEQELKVLLNHDSYQRLFQYFNLDNQAAIRQSNYYYDFPDGRLKQVAAILRLRNYETKSEWTFKQQTQDHIAQEISQFNPQPIAPQPNHALQDYIHDSELLAQLKALGPLEQLRATYDLTTIRYQIPCSFGEFALDESHYLNHIDYEIELETDDLNAGLAGFQALLTELNIPWQVADKKIARVARRYQELQDQKANN